MALSFGTAGIRGPLGPGPEEMNLETVHRVSNGIAVFLADRLGDELAFVVVGYDARHESEVFAREIAETVLAAGHSALLLPGPLPTPVLAYAIRALDADAGVMVTASHNPASDNGLKVYLGGRLTDDAERGTQIVSPTDLEIQQRIASLDGVSADKTAPIILEECPVFDGEIEAGYIGAITGLVPPPVGEIAARRAATSIVLTPLHGVGGTIALAVFAAAGFTDIRLVPEQAEPDPDFPTVPFPNPEEPGAMDMALSLAKRTEADLAIALDPDADRCGLAVETDGHWRALTGDQIGCLLGEWVADRLATGEVVPGVKPNSRTLASSIVSSRLLGAIASRHGLTHFSTLTGFKWLARVPELAFAYEEALGYCVAPEVVRDKDGIAAALLIAEYASLLSSRGLTIGDALDSLDRTYGVHLTRLIAMGLLSQEALTQMVAYILTSPPETLGGFPIVVVDDARKGLDSLPPTLGIRLRTASGACVIVRPSGTEPKIKAYLEVVCPATGNLNADRASAQGAMKALESDVRALLLGIPPVEHGSRP